MNDYRLLGLENAEPYKLKSSTDLYRIPPPPMLIDGFAPMGSIMGFTASPGCGKTWLTLEMMRSCSTGEKFLGQFSTKQVGVLFVGSDSSIYDYGQQWRRLTVRQWASLNPDVDEQSPHDYANPLDENVRFLIQSDFRFENIDSIKRILRTAQTFEWGPLHDHEVYNPETGESTVEVRRNSGFGLIVFDTYSALTHIEQNDNTGTANLFRNVRLISEFTGATLVVVHHNGKRGEYNEGDDWRGASSAEGAIDSRVQLTRYKTDRSLVGVEFKRFRGITPAPFSYVMNVDDEEEASLVWTERDASASEKIEDEIVDSVVSFLLSPEALSKQFSLKQIATAIWPDHSSFFGEDRSKFEPLLRARIENEVRRVNSRIVKDGAKGRRSLYQGVVHVSKRERSDDDGLSGD